MIFTDVLIVGGGPAGASLSQFLKDRGISSIVIERFGKNRNKICAGGIPLAINALLPQRLQNFEKVEYDSLEIFYKSRLTARSSKKVLFSYGVKRSDFDSYLRIGIDVRYHENFLNFEKTNNKILARTDKGDYSAKFLVGADGVGSKVSLLSGLAPKKRFIVAEEAEVPAEVRYKNTLKIFLGYNSIGYGWIFPKNGFLSVGSGSLKSRFRKGTVFSFYPGQYKAKIYPISLWGGEEVLHKGRVALVGEAANLVDPFSAGGIYPAVLSSFLLSEVIAKSLKNGRTSLEEYEKLLNDKLYPNFRYALFLSRMFYPFLPFVKKYVVKSSTIDLALELTSKGYISYEEFYKKVHASKHIALKAAYFIIKKFFG